MMRCSGRAARVRTQSLGLRMRERTARRQRAQGLQNAAAHLPVGAVEPLPRPCAFLSEPGHAGLTNSHCGCSGHCSHCGAFAVHTSAPSSITAWFHSTDCSAAFGSTTHASARSSGVHEPPKDSTPRNARLSARRIFVSITATRSPYAKLSTALAV